MFTMHFSCIQMWKKCFHCTYDYLHSWKCFFMFLHGIMFVWHVTNYIVQSGIRHVHDDFVHDFRLSFLCKEKYTLSIHLHTPSHNKWHLNLMINWTSLNLKTQTNKRHLGLYLLRSSFARRLRPTVVFAAKSSSIWSHQRSR